MPTMDAGTSGFDTRTDAFERLPHAVAQHVAALGDEPLGSVELLCLKPTAAQAVGQVLKTVAPRGTLRRSA